MSHIRDILNSEKSRIRGFLCVFTQWSGGSSKQHIIVIKNQPACVVGYLYTV